MGSGRNESSMFALLLFGWFGLVWFGLALLGLAVDSWDIRVSKCVCVCAEWFGLHGREHVCTLMVEQRI